MAALGQWHIRGKAHGADRQSLFGFLIEPGSSATARQGSEPFLTLDKTLRRKAEKLGLRAEVVASR